jgi:hypothetical protein
MLNLPRMAIKKKVKVKHIVAYIKEGPWKGKRVLSKNVEPLLLTLIFVEVFFLRKTLAH